MFKFLKYLIFILIVNFTLYIVPFKTRIVFASDFSSYNKVTYTLNEDNSALIFHEVSVVNNTADLYISKYTLSLSGNEITKIESFDKVGIVKTNIEKKDSTNLLTLTFNEKAVGKGKILSFIVRYQIQNFVKTEGNLRKVILPKLININDIEEYQMILKVPKIFGKLAYVNPLPEKTESDKSNNIFYFNKTEVSKNGVVATFGPYQTFDFKLFYEIENKSNLPVNENIAIPPDTNYQTVIYNKFNPKPEKIEKDEDGNWFLIYNLKTKEKLKIEVSGKVNIFSSPKYKNTLTKEDENKYLQPQKYWPVDNEKIKNIVENYNTPREIYDYVSNLLAYDYDLVNKNAGRRGALNTLKDPENSICTDFTDLFITIARASGIPVRELQGYAYSNNEKLKELGQNEDLLHSWPQYYDKEKSIWIMVDPTFANTSNGMDFFNQFDMAHFVFAIHGSSDSYPYPAGSYKNEGSEERQLYISLSENPPVDYKKIEVIDLSPKKIFSLLQNNLNVTLENKSGEGLYDNEVLIASKDAPVNKNLKIDVLLPYSKVEKQVLIKPAEKFKDYNLEITLASLGDNYVITLRVKSLLLRIVVLTVLILILILFFLLLSLKKHQKIQFSDKTAKII